MHLVPLDHSLFDYGHLLLLLQQACHGLGAVVEVGEKLAAWPHHAGQCEAHRKTIIYGQLQGMGKTT